MIKFDNLLLTFMIVLILTASAMALQHVEDFEYPTPGSNTFTNGVFEHNILPPVGGQPGSEWWEITDDFVNPPPISGNALGLAPAIDQITFDLNPGEQVDYAAVDFVDWGGNTTFEVIGTLDTYSVSTLGGWVFVDTTGQTLGEITMIKLSSYEGAFDNLTINVVPEPATFLLLGLGSLGLIKKRRAQAGKIS